MHSAHTLADLPDQRTQRRGTHRFAQHRITERACAFGERGGAVGGDQCARRAVGAEALQHFDAVVWNNVSGDVLTLGQRAALRDYVEKGGGFAGFHGSAGDPLYLWDWYADSLIGARFAGHPSAPQFQTARLIVEDRTSEITRDLGSGWTLSDEWYSFKESPRARGAHILVSCKLAERRRRHWCCALPAGSVLKRAARRIGAAIVLGNARPCRNRARVCRQAD